MSFPVRFPVWADRLYMALLRAYSESFREESHRGWIPSATHFSGSVYCIPRKTQPLQPGLSVASLVRNLGLYKLRKLCQRLLPAEITHLGRDGLG